MNSFINTNYPDASIFLYFLQFSLGFTWQVWIWFPFFHKFIFLSYFFFARGEILFAKKIFEIYPFFYISVASFRILFFFFFSFLFFFFFCSWRASIRSPKLTFKLNDPLFELVFFHERAVSL